MSLDSVVHGRLVELGNSCVLSESTTPDGKINVFNLEADEEGRFVTETLAEIYFNQRVFDKAIKAYEILSLKYPEKSSFFADRIRAIKKEKNS